MVEEVLGSLEITPVETFEETFSSIISDVSKGMSSEVIKAAIKEYPDIEVFLIEKVGKEGSIAEQAFTRMTLSAVTKQRTVYQQLHSHYEQLIEFLPRYSTIQNRSGFLEGAIGFAAGFFGGYAGAAGAEAWGNWRNSGDEEFCQKFADAFEQFAQSCIQYTNDGEEKLSIIYDRLTDEMRRIHHLIFECYDDLADAGWDIEPLYKRYRVPEEHLDDESRNLFEIVVANLEENRSVHFRSIENIRDMIGLNDNSVPLQKHVDDNLPPNTIKEKTESVISELTQSPSAITIEFIEKIIGRFSCNGFYLGNEAPEKKINGAVGSYAPQIKSNMVLLLCDNTVFGSAKDGFILTPTTIHWRNSGEGAKYLRINSIQVTSIDETRSIFKAAKIILDDDVVEVNAETVKDRNQIAHQIVKIIKAANRVGGRF